MIAGTVLRHVLNQAHIHIPNAKTDRHVEVARARDFCWVGKQWLRGLFFLDAYQLHFFPCLVHMAQSPQSYTVQIYIYTLFPNILKYYRNWMYNCGSFHVLKCWLWSNVYWGQKVWFIFFHGARLVFFILCLVLLHQNRDALNLVRPHFREDSKE